MRNPHFQRRHGGLARFAGRGRNDDSRGGYGLQRAERVLDRSDLQLLLLSLLEEQSQHGYELIRKIKSLSKGCYAPSPGMVYPTLNAMADDGLAIQVSVDAGRKSFAITDAGKKRMLAEKSAIAAVLARLEALAAGQTQVRAPIARALANLDMVLGNLPLDAKEEHVDQVVSLIDGAARQIERIG